MLSKSHFIKATEEFNTFENNVPAYYFRRKYHSEESAHATVTIAVCGFYELFFNGEKITRGFLSPYISNTDDYIYYDVYEVALRKGENVFGVILGNGLQNNPGGHIWDFDKAPFRSAPAFALTVTQGEAVLLHSDETFVIAPSPIRSDDYRFGEYYDANYEIENWSSIGFDDTKWMPALSATAPKGELRQADIAPITKHQELTPVEIIPCEDGGFLYDFGQSNAGVCRLRIQGRKGQKIEMRYADALKDGDLNLAQIWFVREHWERDKHIVHRDTYICSGSGTEEYQPTFTYHGFRFVKVSGITEEQATKDLLTYLVYHTQMHTIGDFTCSDGVAATLQQLTRRSILSNFHHFPTDCPQREKNGWTADAALSCEAALLNFDPERNYREWVRNICKAQREDGALPGIVPTGGWGFAWGNGPAWDCVLAQLPYFTYLYRGQTEMIRESAQSFIAYLRYLRSRVDEKGLLHIGLGDWCQVGGIDPKAPLSLTDTIMAMDTAGKIAEMLDVIKQHKQAEYARDEAAKYKEALRKNLIDFHTMYASGNCQSSQAMCLFYGVFEASEQPAAFDRLLEMIHAADDHIDVGVLGGRVLFHVLSRFGCSDLALHMITREDYPSYGNWVKRGATTLWEIFDRGEALSMNHHFWGDISAWFIKCIAGIQLSRSKDGAAAMKIKPAFIEALDDASAFHHAPEGTVAVSWKRENREIALDVKIPEGINATLELPAQYCIIKGSHAKTAVSGTYRIARTEENGKE